MLPRTSAHIEMDTRNGTESFQSVTAGMVSSAQKIAKDVCTRTQVCGFENTLDSRDRSVT